MTSTRPCWLLIGATLSRSDLFDYTGQGYVGEFVDEDKKTRATTAAQLVVFNKLKGVGRKGMELGEADSKLAHKLWLNGLVESRHPDFATRRWFVKGSAESVRKLWTNSRARAERLCNYWAHIKYNEGYRETREAEPLWFGTLVHKGLEVWWATGGDLAVALTAMGVTGDPDRKALFVIAREMMKYYHDRWIGDVARFDFLGAEIQFRVRLRNPETGRPSQTWDLGGKMDAVVRLKSTGKIWVVEHKTTSEEIGHDATVYGIRLLMDSQCGQYWIAAEEKYGEKIGGIIYDVLRKPGIRPKEKLSVEVEMRKETDEELAARKVIEGKPKLRHKKVQVDPDAVTSRPETLDEYAIRVAEDLKRDDRVYLWRTSVFRDKAALEDFMQDAWDLSFMSHERMRRGKHPKNPEQCMHHGRPCALLDHCATQSNLDQDPRWVKSKWAHPELSEEVANEV